VNLAIEKKGAAVLARVEDTQIGADSAEEFRKRILGELPEGSARLAIDLSRVDFMDSSGLGAVVSVLKTVRPQGEMVLFGVQPGVLEILKLTHLDSVFTCEPDEESALAVLERQSPSPS
jgi:anti-sigma B factor antagonist